MRFYNSNFYKKFKKIEAKTIYAHQKRITQEDEAIREAVTEDEPEISEYVSMDSYIELYGLFEDLCEEYESLIADLTETLVRNNPDEF